MRWANFMEGLLFTVGFLFLCLVILTGRSSQATARLAPAPVRKRLR